MVYIYTGTILDNMLYRREVTYMVKLTTKGGQTVYVNPSRLLTVIQFADSKNWSVIYGSHKEDFFLISNKEFETVLLPKIT